MLSGFLILTNILSHDEKRFRCYEAITVEVSEGIQERTFWSTSNKVLMGHNELLPGA